MNFATLAQKIKVTGVARDGSKHELRVLQSVDSPSDFGFNVLVQLPDVKADPQAISDLQHQSDGQAAVMRAMQAEIEQWKKRFDALLFQKGGAA